MRVVRRIRGSRRIRSHGLGPFSTRTGVLARALSHRRETTVHHADLGLDFAWSDWDPEYVRAELARLTPLWASRKPMGLTELPPEALRAGDHHRVAWLLGRAEIEGLGAAGINP